MRKNALFLIFLVFALKAAGQELLFREFDFNKRLPSEECYSVIQDKKGYIWIATEEGFCKYSKGKIEIFNKKNGIPEKAVYASGTGPDNVVRIGTSANRFLYYDGKVFRESPYQKAYNNYTSSLAIPKVNYPVTIYEEKNRVFLHHTMTTLIYNKITKKFSRTAKAPLSAAVFIKTKGLPLICSGIVLATRQAEKKTDRIIIKEAGRKDLVYLVNLTYSGFQDHYCHTAEAGKNQYVSIDKYLVVLKSDGKAVQQKFASRVLALKADKNGGLWVGLLKGGVIYFPDPGNLNRGIRSLTEYSVTGICEDLEQGIWCSTLERGVFYCGNKFIAGFAGTEGLNAKGTLMQVIGNRFYFSSSASKLFVFDKYGNYTVKKNLRVPGYSRMNALAFRENDAVIAEDGCLGIFDKELEHFKGLFRDKKDGNSRMTIYEFSKAGKDIYFLGYRVIFRLDRKSNDAYMFRLIYQGAARHLLNIGDSSFLVGGKEYLILLNSRSGKYHPVKGISSEVTSIFRNRRQEIFIATRDNGILKFDLPSMTAFPLQVKLPTEVIYSIAEDDRERLWLASNKGLLRLTRTSSGYSCDIYSTKHGLPSNFVSSICINGKTCYFSTNEGLFFFNTDNELICRTPQSVHLSSLSVNGSKQHFPGHTISLKYNQNSLKLDFDITAFKPGVAVKYELFYENSRSSETIEGNEFSLANLNPGNYKLLVHILNNDGYESAYPWKLYIVITPPFWTTPWFIIVAVALTIAAVILLAFVTVKRIKQKEESKTLTSQLLADYQMSALQAQMNPHFIFNAINTIQGYILSQNKDEAYNYLTQFSKLIRLVLHHSQEKNVPLEDELEMLKLYIELEQLRFDRCFDYIIEIGEETEIYEAFIPSMVIQPFIENAIWHGIINLKKSRQGLLKLSVNQTEDELLVVIEDNGVGRSAAAHYKTSQHKSVALSVTRQRIEILNRQAGNSNPGLTITDLYNASGEGSGTRVEIRLPLRFSDVQTGRQEI